MQHSLISPITHQFLYSSCSHQCLHTLNRAALRKGTRESAVTAKMKPSAQSASLAVLALSAFLVTAYAQVAVTTDTILSFSAWKRAHNKVYATPEESVPLAIPLLRLYER